MAFDMSQLGQMMQVAQGLQAQQQPQQGGAAGGLAALGALMGGGAQQPAAPAAGNPAGGLAGLASLLGGGVQQSAGAGTGAPAVGGLAGMLGKLSAGGGGKSAAKGLAKDLAKEQAKSIGGGIAKDIGKDIGKQVGGEIAKNVALGAIPGGQAIAQVGGVIHKIGAQTGANDAVAKAAGKFKDKVKDKVATRAGLNKPDLGRLRTASVSPNPLPDKVHLKGWAEKTGGRIKTWKNRYFVLTDSRLKYYVEQTDPRPKGSVNIRAAITVREHTSKAAPLGIEIELPKRTYLLRFPTQAQRDKWYIALKLRLDILRGNTTETDTPFVQESATKVSTEKGSLVSAPAVQPKTVSGDLKIQQRNPKRAFLSAPSGTVGLQSHLDRLVQLSSIFDNSGTGIVAVTGPRGSGKTTLLREYYEYIASIEFVEEKPGFRTVFAKLCPKCRFCEFAEPGATELFSVADGEGATTLSKDKSIHPGDPCSQCKDETTEVHKFVFAEEEIVQLEEYYPKNNATSVPTSFIRCPECAVTGIPLTPDGVCISHEGSLFAATGQEMPSIDSPAWTTALPQLTVACAKTHISGVQVQLHEDQVKLLASLLSTCAVAVAGSVAQPLWLAQDATDAKPVNTVYPGFLTNMYFKLSQRFKDSATPDDLILGKDLKACADELAKLATTAAVNSPVRVFTIDHLSGLELGSHNMLDWVPSQLTTSVCQVRLVFAVDDDDTKLLGALKKLAKDRGVGFEELKMAPLTADEVQELSTKVAEELKMDAFEDTSALVEVVGQSPGYIRLAYGLVRLDAAAKSSLLESPPSFDDLLVRYCDTLSSKFGDTFVKHWLMFSSSNHGILEQNFLTEAFQHMQDDRVEFSADTHKALIEATTGVLITTKIFYFSPYVKQKIIERYGNMREYQFTAYDALLDITSQWNHEKMSALFRLPFRTGVAGAMTQLLSWSFINHCLFLGYSTLFLWLNEYVTPQIKGEELKEWQARLDFIRKNYAGLKKRNYQSVVVRYEAGHVTGDLYKIIHGQHVDAILPSKLCRIFTSSTFDDLKVERDALMKDGYPRLREKCRDLGIEFQVVDMRWGIRDESTDDHQTTAICVQEIEQCQKLSIGPNFITFLSQRYGYRPFPATIESAEFEQLLGAAEKKAKSALTKWFKKDENYATPVYKLQAVSSLLPDFLKEGKKRDKAKAKWWDDFSLMSTGLREAALKTLPEDRQLKYVFSVTENEIRDGVMARTPEDRAKNCIWFKRNIVDLEEHVAKGDSAVGKFTDLVWGKNEIDPEAKTLLDKLRSEELPAALPKDHVHEFDVKFAPGAGIDPAGVPEHKAYIDRFVATFVEKVSDSIEDAVQNFPPSRGVLFEEIYTHLDFAKRASEGFKERASTVARLQEYASDDHRHPLVVFGPSGCGKTNLLAKFVADYAAKDTALIARFAGVTVNSSNVDDLLASLINQLQALFGSSEDIPDTAQGKATLLKRLLNEASEKKKVLLVLDSLDQLSDNFNGRLVHKWLPLRLNQHCKIIISTVHDSSERVFPSVRKLLWGQHNFENSFYLVPEFNRQDAQVILNSWLERDQRKLSDGQQNSILDAFEKSKSPLFLELAYDSSRKWKSYTPAKETKLPGSIQELLDLKFTQLERTHGRVLVEQALKYLTVARDGLSTAELEDIISLDESALDDVFQYWTPPIRRLPPLLWVRARRDIGKYLIESTSDGVTMLRWAHRQFINLVRRRYLGYEVRPVETATTGIDLMQNDKDARVKLLAIDTATEPLTAKQKAVHSALADYFLGKWAETPKPDSKGVSSIREVAKMPSAFSKLRDTSGDFVSYNERKIRELPFHLAASERKDELVECLTDEVVLNYVMLKKLFGTLNSQWQIAYPTYKEAFQAYARKIQTLDKKDEVGVYRYAANAMTYANVLSFTNLEVLSPLVDGLQTADQASGAAGLPVGTAELSRANGLLYAGHPAEALQVVESALEKSGLHAETTAGLYYVRGEIHRLTGKVDSAIIDFSKCKDVYVEQDNCGDRYIAVLNAIGQCLFLRQNYQQAINIWKEGMDRVERKYTKEDEMYATLCNNLANLYMECQQFGLAEEFFTHCVNIRQQVLGSRHASVGEAFSNLGAYLCNVSEIGPKRYEEALPLLERAVEIATIGDTGDSEEILIAAKNGLAGCIYKLGRLEDAQAMMESVVADVKSAQTITDNDKKRMLGESLGSLGTFLLDAGKFAQALPYFEESLQLKKQAYATDHPSTGLGHECIALCHQGLGNKAKMDMHVKEAMRIQQRHAQMTQGLVA